MLLKTHIVDGSKQRIPEKEKNPKSDEVIGAQFVCYSHLPTLLAVKISSMDITKSTKDKQTNKQTQPKACKDDKEYIWNYLLLSCLVRFVLVIRVTIIAKNSSSTQIHNLYTGTGL